MSRIEKYMLVNKVKVRRLSLRDILMIFIFGRIL